MPELRACGGRAFQGGANYGDKRNMCWEDPHESSISRTRGRNERTLDGVKAFPTYFCFGHPPTLLDVYTLVPFSAFPLNRPNDESDLAKENATLRWNH